MTDRSIDRAACLALAERVEKGEDLRRPTFAREIFTAVGIETRDWGAPDFRVRDRHDASWVARPLLYSIDATEALRERLLPGSLIGIDAMQGGALAGLWPHGLRGGCIEGRAPTEPAARLAAILRAVAAQQEEKDR